MDTPEYEVRAALTAPDSAVMHLNMVPPKALYGILMNLRTFEPDINACKKLLVYGPKAPDGIADKLAVYEERDACPFNPGQGFNAKVAHGIIGVISETLELGDNLITSLFGGDELDTGNIKEEVGDILWYLARLAKASGFTLAEAMDGNIAKLEVRHLNKTGGFNPDAATEEGRDREAEQAAAEAASGGQTNYAGRAIKQSSSAMSTLAADVLNRTGPDAIYNPEIIEQLVKDARSLAGSVLSQDETKGQEPRARGDGGEKPMERRLWELNQATITASSPGNYDANPYMHGMANGLILANATMKDEDPAYLEWPDGKPVEMDMTDNSKANLGLASNAELEAELTARRELGHTDPDYRTVDASPEVQRQMNYRGDALGEKQPAAEPTQHVHAADGDSAD